MKRYLVLFIFVTTLWIGGSPASAAVSLRYEPAPILTLTGANSDVSFAVTDDIVDAGASSIGPELDTSTLRFRGAFYIEAIGWALLSTGSLEVQLDCGGQNIRALSADCRLSGTAWSETIGDIDMSAVIYRFDRGVLEGMIHTHLGDVRIDGISLPLLPAVLEQSLSTTLPTNHETAFSIQDAQRYGDGLWSINIRPVGQIYSQDYSLGMVDLSYASTYEFRITDPQGSRTYFDGVSVIPNSLSSTLTPGSLFIANFCNNYPIQCPDGATRSATLLQRTNPTNPIADGKNFYDFSLKIRDQYGNALNTGTITVAYSGMVSAIQGEDFLIHPYIANENMHDGLVFAGKLFLTDYQGYWWLEETLFGQSIQYQVASIAPTVGSNNTVTLAKLEYKAPDGTTTTLSDITPLTFTSPYDVTLQSIGTPKVGKSHSWSGEQITHTTQAFSPDITALFSIGNGISARMENLDSAQPKDCSGPDNYTGKCDYFSLGNRPGVIVGAYSGTFDITGIYTPKTAHPIEEDVAYATYIHYQTYDNFGSLIDVFYPGAKGSESAQFAEKTVKIIGNNNALGAYGTIGTSKKIKTEFMAQVRKNAALLSRNRTQYADVAYTISTTGFANITDASFSDKRTLISIGQDIRITGNISAKSAPLALIALTDESGNGGNIIIDPSVTDIAVSLVAEHAITTAGKNQLYILGSVISSNTIGETVASICPYFVTAPCTQLEAAKYDLEEMRKGFGSGNVRASHPTALKYPTIPLIIEYDRNLERNPPPGF